MEFFLNIIIFLWGRGLKMQQMKLPFEIKLPPYACCTKCKFQTHYTCDKAEKCLHKKGRYIKRGGKHNNYYNLFEERGD